MLYAQIVLGIPVEGPFDYIVPEHFYKKINSGARVWVNFANRRMLGYVVKLTPKSRIKNLKVILDVLDNQPVLDKNMLSLTKRLSDYYCCSWGEAIETALPEGLRKGKGVLDIKEMKYNDNKDNPEVTLIQDLDGQARWDIYLKSIKETLDNNKSVIVLLPDINSVLKAKEKISLNLKTQPALLYRKQPKGLEEWLKIKEGKVNIVLGTRSGIFAPLNNLGLVIIDEEQDSVYKQDQMPHYHAREIAFMRASLEKTKLILGSVSPSLEMLYLAKKNKVNYVSVAPKSFPEVKVVDIGYGHYSLGRKSIFSKYLEDAITLSLNLKGKVLLFLNRRGFATFAFCQHCGSVLKCPRCNINLVYHFKENLLSCHYCNFKMPPPNICPHCNSSYIRYGGAGTEKVESELNRIFAQAKIKRLDSLRDLNFEEADIFIATESIIQQTGYSFEVTGVLGIDNSLNRIDFRSGEKTFGLLLGILGLTKEKIIIQTKLANHHCFQALINKDINKFYNEELKERQELKFPPFKHLGIVKLRGEKESKVREVSESLFERLNKYNSKIIKIIAVNPAHPSKLRGKFCWQILVRANSAFKITEFLKKHLKDFRHSGIIVTVDIDPL